MLDGISNFFNDLRTSFTSIDYSAKLDIIIYNGLQIILIIFATWLIMKWRTKFIRKVFKITKLDYKRESTLSSLLLSLTKYVIIAIAVLMILIRLNVEITPILASAGVLGLALGFGAQNLIKDIIAGFFLLFEDWMHVGDYVKIGEVSGTVEEIGLRTTVIREWSGKQVHLLNSSISQLVNYNREKMRPIVSFNIPYEYPSDEVRLVIEKACEDINRTYEDYLLKDSFGNIIEPVQLYGITDVENNALGVKYTVIGLVKDEHYFLMSKEIKRILLKHLIENNIKVAYPKRIYTNDTNIDYDMN